MNGIGAYQETAVLTQDKGKLIVMLYEGAIKFLHQANAAIEREDYLSKGECLQKAKDIVFELNMCLNMDAGDGEISQNLRSLYNFIYKRIGEANRTCNPQTIDEIVNLLVNLYEGWAKIAGD